MTLIVLFNSNLTIYLYLVILNSNNNEMFIIYTNYLKIIMSYILSFVLVWFFVWLGRHFCFKVSSKT